jgi:hypothetical protein
MKASIWIAAIAYVLLNALLVELGVHLSILSQAGLASLVAGACLLPWAIWSRRRARPPAARSAPGPTGPGRDQS